MSQYQTFYNWDECIMNEETGELEYRPVTEEIYLAENNNPSNYYNIHIPKIAFRVGDVVTYLNANKNVRTTTCPFCKGKRQIKGYNDEWKTCPRCKGSGEQTGIVTYTYNSNNNDYESPWWTNGKIIKTNFHCEFNAPYSNLSRSNNANITNNQYFCDYHINPGTITKVTANNNGNTQKFTLLPVNTEIIAYKKLNELNYQRFFYDKSENQYKLFEVYNPDSNYRDNYNLVRINSNSTDYENLASDEFYKESEILANMYIDDNSPYCSFCCEINAEEE